MKTAKDIEHQVDESLDESFPASDPPAWTGYGVDRDADLVLYNYKNFDAKLFDEIQLNCPEIEKLPNDTIYDLNGHYVSLQDYENIPLVIESGSITCPMYVNHIKTMNKMNESFGGTKFFVLYTRETHPGENYSAHRSINQKLEYARELKETYGEYRDILIDDIYGTLHKKLFNSMPNACICTDKNHSITYQVNWTMPNHIKLLLSHLLISKRDEPCDGVVLPPMPDFSVFYKVLSNAGPQAIKDFIYNIPELWQRKEELKKYIQDNELIHNCEGTMDMRNQKLS